MTGVIWAVSVVLALSTLYFRDAAGEIGCVVGLLQVIDCFVL